MEVKQNAIDLNNENERYTTINAKHWMRQQTELNKDATMEKYEWMMLQFLLFCCSNDGVKK